MLKKNKLSIKNPQNIVHTQPAATFLRAHMPVEYMLKAAKKGTKVSMEKQVS